MALCPRVRGLGSKNKPEAHKALDGFRRRAPPEFAGRLAGWYTQVGALDEAHAILNRTLDEHVRNDWPGLVFTPTYTLGPSWFPEMRPFRRDPRFQQFVTRFKLIDYWKQYGPPDECDLRGDTLACR